MKKENNFSRFIITSLIIIIMFSVLYAASLGSDAEQIKWTEFRAKLVAEEISHIDVVGTGIKARAVDSEIVVEDFPDLYDFFTTHIDAEYIMDVIDNYNAGTLEEQAGTPPTVQVVANFDFEGESLIDQILPFASIILFAILAFVILRSIGATNNKSMGFGKSKAQLSEMPKIRFTDVAGAKEEKEELQEIVEFLKNPKKFTELGARIPKGVLLVGPPGTGKTLLAKAIAGESGVPFFTISGSDFVEMFVGVGASRVRDLFAQAKKNMPCIVFIDEIDAVGRQRGAGLGGGNDEREQTLNQLLVQMDGFEDNEGVIIIAATNRPDVLDPALLRPGRFDRQIVVNVPDVGGREKILEVHARNKPIGDDVDFKAIARLTSGFSGADLENMLNEAAILAARANRAYINMTDITEGFTKVIIGPQKKSRMVTERDKKITAYHEAGHAIIQKVLEHSDEVHEVSIIPRGMAGGYTMTRPDTDDSYYTKNKLMDKIASLMGGRIAEEIIFKDVSSGASNDIKEATKIAKKMVTELGMSKLGFINLGSGAEVFIGRDYSKTSDHSENTASQVDAEIRSILDKNYERATKALKDNMGKLETMTNLLLDKETIYQDEVDMIMEGKSIEEIVKHIDHKLAKKKAKEAKAKTASIKAKKELEKQKQEKLEEIKKRTIEALKKEGLVVTDVKTEEKPKKKP